MSLLAIHSAIWSAIDVINLCIDIPLAQPSTQFPELISLPEVSISIF